MPWHTNILIYLYALLGHVCPPIQIYQYICIPPDKYINIFVCPRLQITDVIFITDEKNMHQYSKILCFQFDANKSNR